MEPPQSNKVWTYDDLASLPDDGKRYEIIDGELVVSPSPSLWHQEVSKRLFLLLYTELEARGIAKVYYAPLDVVLATTRVVVPDIVAVRTERTTILEKRGVFGPPDLAIEVLSPSNARHDRLVKRRLYARDRIPEYWIVDPEIETVEVLELIDQGLTYRLAGFYGPGDRARSATFEIELDIDELFRRDEPA